MRRFESCRGHIPILTGAALKRLYLLRHAKSSWDDPDLRDRDRPLAPRGEKAAGRIAAHLDAQRIHPDLVLCSSALRTRQTLERIVPALGGAEIELEDRLYEAAAEDLLQRLRAVPDAVGSIMLIAHNPGLQDLALLIAGGGQELDRVRERFPTAALATIEHPGAWRALGPGTARLVGLVLAKELP